MTAGATVGYVDVRGSWVRLDFVRLARRGAGLVVAVGTLQLALLFGIGGDVARALSVHTYRSSPHITEVPGGVIPGPVTEVRSLAVDEGRLWAAEHVSGTLSFRTDSFDDSSGAFGVQLAETPPTTAVAAGHAAGEEQVYLDASLEGGEGAVGVFSGSSGALLGHWSGAGTAAKGFGGGVSGIAVDESHAAGDWAAGDVYVADPSQGVVDVFKPKAGGGEEYVAQLPGTFTDPQFVAVSATTGEVFVVDQTENGPVIDVFSVEALVGSYQELRTISEIKNVRGESLEPLGGGLGRVVDLAVNGGEEALYVAQTARVVQLTLTGVLAGEVIGTPRGAFQDIESVASDQESNALFVSDYNSGLNRGAIDAFGPGAVVPDVENGAVSEEGLEDHGGHFKIDVHGEADPLGAGEATCDFAWGPTEALGESPAGCTGPVGNGSDFVPVEAELKKLEPDTEYFYRLQASNANGTNPGSGFGTFTTSGPGLKASWSSDVSAGAATLNGLVDPHGHAASAYFEYGAASGAPGSLASVTKTAELGAGEGEVPVSEHVQGLAPDTTYHYRLVVIGELAGGGIETFRGPDHAFQTNAGGGGAQPLLDGRAWELVSPPVKHGALFASLSDSGGGAIQASADGGRFTDLASLPSEEGAAGYEEIEQVLFERGASGWVSHDISMPHIASTQISASKTDEYMLFSGDLSLGLAEPRGPFTALGSEASPEATERTPFIRHGNSCGGVTGVACYTPLVTGAEEGGDVPADVKFGGEPEQTLVGEAPAAGASEDLRHVAVLVEAGGPSLTSTPTPEGGLYEWSADKPASEALQLVSLLPTAPGEEPSAAGSPHLGAFVIGINVAHAVSADGSRVIWSTGALDIGHLYMRDTVRGETVELDAPTTGSGEATRLVNGPVYQAASADDSTVFFMDNAELIKGQSGVEGYDLYACQMRVEAGHLKCALSDLTPEVVEGQSAEVQGMALGASQDGSYVYFVARGVLTNEANAQGEHAVAGGENLYVVHRGAGGFEGARLVAVLSPDDRFDWAETSSNEHDEAQRALTARVSPNGMFLAFMSDRSLTGYDNRDAVSGRPDQEVYEYDVVSGRVVCVSCMPSGARPEGKEGSAANVPGWTPLGLFEAWYQSRYLSDSGRLFFNSLDGLAPEDKNGAQDVYEFEPANVGGCGEGDSGYHASLAGCVGLVSSGKVDAESSFLDASENGGDVFFLTSASLSPRDEGNGYDVYDAHECTAESPCSPERMEEPVVCGEVEECRGKGGEAEAVGGGSLLPSASASGDGNVPSKGAHKNIGKHKRRHKRHKHEKRRRHRRRKAGRGLRRRSAHGGVFGGGR